MVGHLLKVGAWHWLPHWKCTVNLSWHISFAWPNLENGRKMANGQLLFQALLLCLTHSYVVYPFTAIFSNAHWTMPRKCVLQINHYTYTHKIIHYVNRFLPYSGYFFEENFFGYFKEAFLFENKFLVTAFSTKINSHSKN